MGTHGPEFSETRLGRTFLEGTMPNLVKVLGRIADLLDHLDTIQGNQTNLFARIRELETRLEEKVDKPPVLMALRKGENE